MFALLDFVVKIYVIYLFNTVSDRLHVIKRVTEQYYSVDPRVRSSD